MRGEALDVRQARAEDARAQRVERGGRVAAMRLQRRHVGHRVVVDVEDMGVDQADQVFDRNVVGLNGAQHLRRHRIGAHGGTVGAGAPAVSASRHHCSRTSPVSAWVTWSRTCATSALKAAGAPASRGAAPAARTGSLRRTENRARAPRTRRTPGWRGRPRS